MRKIIGFKLIKQYPLSPDIPFTLADLSVKLINIYSQFPEFWEPIYEEVGVDLQKIYDRIFFDKTGNQVCDSGRLTRIETTIEMMKEACKQTLELVKRYGKVSQRLGEAINVYTYEIDDKSIDNILTMIK